MGSTQRGHNLRMKYELWMAADPSNGYSLIREDNVRSQELARSEGMCVVWSTVAKGPNEANQLLYDHLGYGTYNVFLGEDGEPFPEDEDDSYAPDAK
jgi:hypothetical protein